MPLNASQLASDIEAVFLSEPPDGATAAKKIAAAYDNYCKAGLAGGVPPVLTGVEAARFEGPLASGFSAGAASAVANGFKDGVTAYWVSPPVPFAAPPIAGVTTSVAGAGAIVGPLTGILENSSNTQKSSAQQIAQLLDQATKTVLVTFTAPQPTPPSPANLA